MKKWFYAFTMALLLVGCSAQTGSNQGEGKLNVTTTTGQIADIVENIGKDLVKVDSLMGPGVDPHLYQASQGDIKKLSDANIIFYNGLHLEGKMGEILEKMSKDKPVVAVGESVPKDLLLMDEEDETENDPHIWFDIELWKYAVEAVRDALSELDPDNKDVYYQNTETYMKKLDDLQEYSRSKIAEIPEDSRVLVTAHDAFQYFGNAYDFEVMGLQGLSTDSEYGLRDVQELVNVIVERNIKAVFIETSISDRSINAVIEGAKQKNHTVIIGGELYSDAMGEAGTEQGTYIGMYKHNIDTIVSSLK